jgi:hypothetical protein
MPKGGFDIFELLQVYRKKGFAKGMECSNFTDENISFS